MEKYVKRKLRKLWRDRVLISIGGLLVFGFSALQAQSVFKHRSVHRSWVLELSQATEIIEQEGASKEEIGRAIEKIQRISQERNLEITQILFQALDKDLARTLDLALAWKRNRNRNLRLDVARDMEQIQNRYLDRTRVMDLARTRARARNLARDQSKALELERTLERALEQARVLEQDLEQALERDLERALERALKLDVALGLARTMKQNRFLYYAEQPNELVKILNQTEKNLLVFIIAKELQATHGYTLQQGNTLETLLSSEPNRARTLLQSGILLGVSTLVLIGLLVVFTRIQGSHNLPRTANLIAFLPEECVAELGYLQRRLKKANKSPWQIHRRLIHEFVFLLWVHYVQMQIDNLFLGSGQDHTIDD